MVTTTVNYRKPGVRPPVFIAGSFTNPEWVPREMNWVLDGRGESLFTIKIEVDPDRDYQYKFKVGYGNDWDLDEQSPITSDDVGNKNNLLVIHSELGSQDEARREAPEILDQSSQPHQGASSQPGLSTGIHSVESYKSLDLQDQSYALLHSDPSWRNPNRKASREHPPELDVSLDGSRIGSSTEEEVVPSTPLFAHECLGAYDFDVVDDGFDHSLSPTASRDLSKASLGTSGTFASGIGDSDLLDPTLERFPCDKDSVMSTLRRISTSTGEGMLPVEDRPSSSQFALRRTSVDSNADSISSAGSLSPTSSRKRDSRLSHSSFIRTRSAVSLGSIVEEPSKGADLAGPSEKVYGDRDDSPESTSDEDGPQLKGAKVSSIAHNVKGGDAQIPSVVLSTQTPNESSDEHKESRGIHQWDKKHADGPVEGKWFITGSVVLLALGIVCWKSYHV